MITQSVLTEKALPEASPAARACGDRIPIPGPCVLGTIEPLACYHRVRNDRFQQVLELYGAEMLSFGLVLNSPEAEELKCCTTRCAGCAHQAAQLQFHSP